MVQVKIVEHPIALCSRTLNKQESKLPAIELESMAVVFAFKQFRPYVYGYKSYVQTDHSPLKWLLNTTLPSGRLQKAAMQLAEYDYEISYRPAAQNKNADALSRITVNRNCCNCATHNTIHISFLNRCGYLTFTI